MGIVENAEEFARNAWFVSKKSYPQVAKLQFDKTKELVALIRECGGDERIQTIGYLNRAMEATGASEDTINAIRQKFGQDILEKVLMLTKTPGENTVSFLSKIKSDADLRLIFICEIVSRVAEDPSLERKSFYAKALLKL